MYQASSQCAAFDPDLDTCGSFLILAQSIRTESLDIDDSELQVKISFRSTVSDLCVEDGKEGNDWKDLTGKELGRHAQ